MTETNKPPEGVNPKQRRALIQLTFHDGRLEKVGGLKPDLDTKLRRPLGLSKYLEKKTVGRGIALELTDAGWPA